MTTYFLKFSDKDAAKEALSDFINNPSAHYAVELDVPVTESTGATLTDDDGNEYEETARVPGYHVNLRLLDSAYEEQVEALSQYQVSPVTPQRVFF